MTLTKSSLWAFEDSMHILFTKEQERIILDCFGAGSEDGCEWSEQDIMENIRHICRDHPAAPSKAPF